MSAARSFQHVAPPVRDAGLPFHRRSAVKRPVAVRAVATAPKSGIGKGTGDSGLGVSSSLNNQVNTATPSTRSATNIPVVDLRESDDACASIVRQSLFHGVGFFHVVNHGIPSELFNKVIQSATQFFDQPYDAKLKLTVGDMKLSRGYEVSPEHLAEIVTTENKDVGAISQEKETQSSEPSALCKIAGERFSMGPFDLPKDDYHRGEDGELFFAPNVWPKDELKDQEDNLQTSMQSYYSEMEVLSNRLLRIIAVAGGAPADFFEPFVGKHVSNLQVANYPSLRAMDWGDASQIPPRKKAHADSGTLTVLARGVGAVKTHVSTNSKKAGLQVLDGEKWRDVPVLPGGDLDGPNGKSLLVNVGNQLQRWSDDRWPSTKHRVTNPPLIDDSDSRINPKQSSTRRTSIAFFHKSNYDVTIDPGDFLKFGGFELKQVSGNNPPATAGSLSRVGMLRNFSEQGMSSRESSMKYHEQMMGVEEAQKAEGREGLEGTEGGVHSQKSKGNAFSKKSSRASKVKCFCLPPDGDGLGLDRGSDDRGAGLGNDNPQQGCPVCNGTGWKPCGQCDGTGLNQEDLFGGKFVKGDTCWLCSGKAKTMCGNCIDLTDTF